MTTRYTIADARGGEHSFWLTDVRAVSFEPVTEGGQAYGVVSVTLADTPREVAIYLPADTARATYGVFMQAWAEAT